MIEELLRESFTIGQQWVKDIDDDKDPISFNDWYNSDEILQLNMLDSFYNAMDEYVY